MTFEVGPVLLILFLNNPVLSFISSVLLLYRQSNRSFSYGCEAASLFFSGVLQLLLVQLCYLFMDIYFKVLGPQRRLCDQFPVKLYVPRETRL